MMSGIIVASFSDGCYARYRHGQTPLDSRYGYAFNPYSSADAPWYYFTKERVTLETEGIKEKKIPFFICNSKAVFTDKYLIIILRISLYIPSERA